MPISPPLSALGGVSVDRFLRRYWQRRPLLVRGAFPANVLPIAPRALFSLAGDASVESRLIRAHRGRWQLQHGPLSNEMLGECERRAPHTPWTVLVQDVNHHIAAADRLLWQFRFVGQARVDDLMVSYASVGGGVGPHVDSYDVFLLQIRGRRRWRIAQGGDRTLLPDLPLRILARFAHEEEWTLDPGDMLYLPPGVAHEGVAVDGPCMTASIGFRWPSAEELQQAWLEHLARTPVRPLPARGLVSPARGSSAELPRAWSRHLATIARRQAPARLADEDFAARLLSEPKPQVIFRPPHRPLPPEAFGRAAEERGLCLDPRSRMLLANDTPYLNGEPLTLPVPVRAAARRLAEQRAVLATKGAARLAMALYPQYLSGEVRLGKP